jgi:hypothetical protein
MTVQRPPKSDVPNENGEIRVGYGKWTLAATGVFNVIIVMFLLLIAANVGGAVFQAWTFSRELAGQTILLTKEHTSRKVEHDAVTLAMQTMKLSLDRNGCIMTLPMEERARFRLNYTPGAWSKICPWIHDQ